jgi:predicted PilT family ATPase
MMMAGDELKRQVIRQTGISVAFAKFTTEASAEIYVDESAIGAVVGPGGQNVRRLEQQLGVKLDVKSVRELPRNQRKRLNSEQDDSHDLSEWKSRSGREWQGGEQGGGRRGKRRKGRGNRR